MTKMTQLLATMPNGLTELLVFLFLMLGLAAVLRPRLSAEDILGSPSAAGTLAVEYELPTPEQQTHDSTDEICLHLRDGKRLYSGWIDHAGPGRLAAGDYLRLEDCSGRELCYIEAADLLNDPIIGRRMLCELFQIAAKA